jgi:transposase
MLKIQGHSGSGCNALISALSAARRSVLALRTIAPTCPATAPLCELILERRPHPEQGFRACLGMVRLVRPFGADRLEAAATRAIEIGTLTYGSVRSILDHKLDGQAPQSPSANGGALFHPNIRGPRYYH